MTEEDDDEDEAKHTVLDLIANQSPLKSGPSTIKGGSTYESPQTKSHGFELTSSMKKLIVPPLNFDKVYEQQRLILEQEERRRIEEEKRQQLLKQQKMKALAF